MIKKILISKKFRHIFALLGTFCIICIPVYFQLKYSLTSELLNNDYSDLHLGHALSIDFWLRGYNKSRNGYFATTHPGILFQISSWFVYFISNIHIWFNYNGYELATITLKGTRSFYFISTLLSSFLLYFILFFVGKKFNFLPVLPFIGLLYGITGEYTHTFLHFTNDYFAIPLGLAWLSIWKWRPHFISTKSFYIWMGFLSSFVYLNKLPYLVWIMAFVITILLFALIKLNSKLLMGLFIYILSFFVSTIVILYCFFDEEGIRAMFSSHLAIVSNSGRMGSGTSLFVNFTDFGNNISYFFKTNSLLSTVTIFLIFAFVIYNGIFEKFARGLSIKKAITSMDPFIVWSLLSFGGGLIATFKHYGYNYLLVSMAPLFLAIAMVYKNKDYLKYLFVMLLIFLSVALNGYYNAQFFMNITNQNRELKKVYSFIPKDQNLTLITEYRNPVNMFTSYHVLFCSDLPQMNDIFNSIHSNNFIYYFEKPNLLYGKTVANLEDIKWDYWVTVYNQNALDWYSKDRSKYLSLNSELIPVDGTRNVYLFKRKK